MKAIVCAAIVVLSMSAPNLYVGTGGFGYGCGSNSPAVQTPFSFVRLGPDTYPLKGKYFQFQHYGGYSMADHAVQAFSHMHLVGAGVIDMGLLGVLPIQSEKAVVPTYSSVTMFKDTEQAEPGYYAVAIADGIQVELTTTQRCGAHRYNFTKKQTHAINIMPTLLLQTKAPRSASVNNCGDNCLQGSILNLGGFGGRFGGYHIHYSLKWRSNANGRETLQLFEDDKFINGNSSKGSKTGAVIMTNASSFELFVGLSYVSVANARNNLQIEIGLANFQSIRIRSKQIWSNELSRFEIAAVSAEMQTKIDTAIYRSLLTPTLFNDHNGDYMSFINDGSVRQVPSDMRAVYTDMSLWDVHRSQFPWIMFHDAQRFRDIAKSIVLINREGGYMPKWPFANGWTGCMIGAHANTVLAEWILREPAATTMNQKQQILSFMLRNANQNTPHDSRPNVKSYVKLGYIAADNQGRSACSETLQLSTNDFAISRVAKFLRESKIQQQFTNRSKFYVNVWNNATNFFEPRFANQSFAKLNAAERLNIFSNHYVEGNAWHYRFVVPQDVEGMVRLFGGKEPLVKQMKIFFERSFFWPTFWLPNPYYWAGNQHDLLTVWLFPFLDRPDLTQQYSRRILDTQYGVEGNGLPGNDDYGTMSAWLIFASLGLFPFTASDNYVLGSPAVHSARILRKTLTGQLQALNILAKKNSVKNHIVDSIHLDGKEVKTTISHNSLSAPNSQLIFIFH